MVALPPTPSAPSFDAARGLVESLIGRLEDDEVGKMDHAAVEALVESDGRAVLLALLKGHFELRALREDRAPMEGCDGVVRGHLRACDRGMVTIFGPVPLQRKELRARGVEGGLRPLDAELNLPPDLYSFGLHRRIAWFSANESFDAVVDTVKQTNGLLLGKRQVEEVARRSAVDFDAFYKATTLEPVAATHHVVLSFDGKGVVMRTEDLREATKRANQRAHRLKHRVSPGEKLGRKRMAEVATVYECAPVVRAAADIMGELDGAPRPKRPKAINKRVWASLEKEPAEVIADAFAEAKTRDERLERPWAVLVDGHVDQLRCIRAEARRVGVKPTFILDVIHAIEYLWKAAWCLFKKADPDAEAWVSERLRRLLEGGVSGVAAGIRRSATKRALDDDTRKPMDACANYLLKYKDMLRYDKFLAAGMPIATGVIEGACRHLIQDRMDITGARWSLDGAEAVLKLRSLRSSGDFDEYWTFHLQAELHRNHLANYATHELGHLRAAA